MRGEGNIQANPAESNLHHSTKRKYFIKIDLLIHGFTVAVS